jgi:CRISPR/Cas system-associated endonuclease Cas3-HD
MRKKTLRKMSPGARKIAKLIGDLESVTRRLKNCLPELEEMEMWAKVAKKQKGASPAASEHPIEGEVGEEPKR